MGGLSFKLLRYGGLLWLLSLNMGLGGFYVLLSGYLKIEGSVSDV